MNCESINRGCGGELSVEMGLDCLYVTTIHSFDELLKEGWELCIEGDARRTHRGQGVGLDRWRGFVWALPIS